VCFISWLLALGFIQLFISDYFWKYFLYSLLAMGVIVLWERLLLPPRHRRLNREAEPWDRLDWAIDLLPGVLCAIALILRAVGWPIYIEYFLPIMLGTKVGEFVFLVDPEEGEE
jgi:hypothetical protein